MRYRVFIGWTAAASALWTGIYVSLAYFLTEEYLALTEQFEWAGWVFIGVVAVLIVVSTLVKKRLERSQRRYMTDEPE